MHDAKTRLSELVAAAEGGEEDGTIDSADLMSNDGEGSDQDEDSGVEPDFDAEQPIADWDAYAESLRKRYQE